MPGSSCRSRFPSEQFPQKSFSVLALSLLKRRVDGAVNIFITQIVLKHWQLSEPDYHLDEARPTSSGLHSFESSPFLGGRCSHLEIEVQSRLSSPLQTDISSLTRRFQYSHFPHLDRSGIRNTKQCDKDETILLNCNLSSALHLVGKENTRCTKRTVSCNVFHESQACCEKIASVAFKALCLIRGNGGLFLHFFEIAFLRKKNHGAFKVIARFYKAMSRSSYMSASTIRTDTKLITECFTQHNSTVFNISR